MLKQTLIVVSLVSLFIVGCSSDPSYKRQTSGNQNYLQSPELRPLTVPQSVTVPTESNEYYVFKATTEGSVGLDLDIRPPTLALPTIADSYAVYDSGVIQLDVPDYVGFWSKIPTILQNNNIAIKSSDSSNIKTDNRLVNRVDEQAVEASYLLNRKLASGREYITVELASLKRIDGTAISSPIDSQYYTTEFFNMMMKAVTPSQSQVGN